MKRVKLTDLLNRQVGKWNVETNKASIVTDDTNRTDLQLQTIITISRQLGSGGEYIAKKVAQKLGFKVYHKKLVDEIAGKANLRKAQIEALDEKSRMFIEEFYRAILLEPGYLTSSEYFKHLSEVILSIAHNGMSVIVGRGAHLILGSKTGLRIRFIASKETRIAKLVKTKKITEKEAEKLVDTDDEQKAYFLKKHFGKKFSDPGDFDLVINTDKITEDEATDIIIWLMKKKIRETSKKLLFNPEHLA
ncbi:MAG: cytidylate kinase-like family protein [Firmicutes bacterium]|nr:cytidylate kinase-like family protein [Bacillota bacterium]